MSGEVLVVDLLYHQDRKVVAGARVDYLSHRPLHLHPRYSRAVLSSLLVKQNIHAIFCGLRHLLLQWDHGETRLTCRGPSEAALGLCSSTAQFKEILLPADVDLP